MAVALVGGPAVAADPPGILVPIGSDYQADTMQLFAAQAVARSADDDVLILVIPITYSLNAYETKNSERKQNLTLAAHRTQQVEDACTAVAGGKTCDAQLVPVLIRPDALDPANLAYFAGEVDGMYVLGGDQTVAMQVVAGTPVEQAMADAYANGAVLGGNSAGDAVQSRTMINGYTGTNGPAESLRAGAVDVWDGDDADLLRGLSFGMSGVVADQHVFEYGRTGRSLNVALSTRKPVLGMDAATGAVLTDGRMLTDVTGDTSGYVIDPGTLSGSATWGGPNDTLSARNVAFHLVPPGDYAFDFGSMEPSVAGAAIPAPDLAGRDYPAVTTPSGSGPLLLSGGIAGDPAGRVGHRFLELSDGLDARIVVLATGYPKAGEAKAAAKAIAAALQPGVTATVQWLVVDEKTDPAAASAAIAAATGILLTSPDRSLVKASLVGQPDVTASIHAAWAAGATLLADDAAAAVLGEAFIADPVSADVEASAPADMLAGGVAFEEGLGWAGDLNVQPRLLPDQSWGQALRLAAHDQVRPAVALDVDTAIEVDGGAAVVVGESAAVVIDGRAATVGVGDNGSLAAAWIVIDSFVAGESLAAVDP
jgi:cyanophycinase-like exopeptidase